MTRRKQAVMAAAIGLASTLGPVPAVAQPAPPPVASQPFGQKPPPGPLADPDRTDRKRPSSWMYRGMVAVDGEVTLAPVIEAPVTGFGNEALWDTPDARVPAKSVAVAAAAKAR